MTDLLNLSETEYNNSYDQAIVIYNEYTQHLDNFEKSQLTESNIQPMHPNLYYQLIRVQGFCDLNGTNYSDYLNKWKKRNNIN